MKYAKGSMNTLEHLSNEELLEYYKLYKKGQDKTHRFEKTKIHRMETKFLYNIVRLIDEAEQIFTEGDLDLQRNREQLKAIRRGEWTPEQIRDYVSRKEKILEEVHITSKLPVKPDVNKVKEVLLQCLEHHYGNLSNYIKVPDRAENLLFQIRQMMADSGY